MNDFESQLGTALRERLAAETTDLHALAASALARGRRERTRHRLAAGVGALAAVAVLGTALAVLAVQGGGERGSDAASDPVPTPTGPTGPTGPTAVPSPPSPPTASGPPSSEFPVRLDLAGWSCEVMAIDGKAVCTSSDGGSVSLNVRGAEGYDSWRSSPDKVGPDDFVSEVHGNFFVTATGDFGGLTPAAFGRGLTFGARWQPSPPTDPQLLDHVIDFPVEVVPGEWQCAAISTTSAACRLSAPGGTRVDLTILGRGEAATWSRSAHPKDAFLVKSDTDDDYVVVVDGGPDRPELRRLVSSFLFHPRD